MNIRKLQGVVVAILCAAGFASADGVRLKDGRYADGPIVELRLTKVQAAQVGNHYQPGMVIQLTRAQQVQIRKRARIPVSPTRLLIYRAKEAENECTCFAFNWAFPFRPGWVEIPSGWLCSDQEFEANQPVD